MESLKPLWTINIPVTRKTLQELILIFTPPFQNNAVHAEAEARNTFQFVAAPVTVNMRKQFLITNNYAEVESPGQINYNYPINMTPDFTKRKRELVKKAHEHLCVGLPYFWINALMSQCDIISNTPTKDDIHELSEYQKGVSFSKITIKFSKRG